MVGSRALAGPQNFTGSFWFEVIYEIDISEQLVGWLKELATDDARRELVAEHLNAKTGHVNVRDAKTEWDADDDLLLEAMGETDDACAVCGRPRSECEA